MAAALRALALAAGGAALASAQSGYQFQLALLPYGTGFPRSTSAITPALQANLSVALGVALGCANPAAAVRPTGVIGFVAGRATPAVFPGYLQIGFVGADPAIASCGAVGGTASTPQATVLTYLKSALAAQLAKSAGACASPAACAAAAWQTTGFPVIAVGMFFADVRGPLGYPDAFTVANFVTLDPAYPPFYGSPPSPPFTGFAAAYATTGVAIIIALAFVFGLVALTAYCFCTRCLPKTVAKKPAGDAEAHAGAVATRNPAAAGAGHGHGGHADAGGGRAEFAPARV